jgi:hypothetical protein
MRHKMTLAIALLLGAAGSLAITGCERESDDESTEPGAAPDRDIEQIPLSNPNEGVRGSGGGDPMSGGGEAAGTGRGTGYGTGVDLDGGDESSGAAKGDQPR